MMEEGIFVFVFVLIRFFWESEEKLGWIGMDCFFVMGR